MGRAKLTIAASREEPKKTIVFNVKSKVRESKSNADSVLSWRLLDDVCRQVRNGRAPRRVASLGLVGVIGIKHHIHPASIQIDDADAVGHRILWRDRLD